MTLGAVASLGVLSNIVHAADDAGVRTTTGVIENLDTVELGLLSNTVAPAANSTRAVSTVAVAVGVLAADEALEEGSTTLKFLYPTVSFYQTRWLLFGKITHRVASLNTSVNDIDASTGTSAVVIAVGGASLGAVRDTAKTPGGTVLLNDAIEVHHSVLLDEVDL